MRRLFWLGTGWAVSGVVGCFHADVDSDGDGTLDQKDCAPDDASIFPGAPERCNGLDDDCDGVIDNHIGAELGTAWYADTDADGYGVTGSVPLIACEAPVGYTQATGDCDDTRADLSPETIWYPDEDFDGFGAEASDTERRRGCLGELGYVRNRLDCDDTNPLVHPEAPEVCNDVDDDCDLEVDEALRSEFYPDADADGFGDANSEATVWACRVPVGYAEAATDCDDDDAGIHPDAERICGDGIDNACDGILGRDTSTEFCGGNLADAAVRVLGSSEGEAFGSTVAVLRDLYGPNDDGIAVGSPNLATDETHVPGGVWVFRVEDLLNAESRGGWLDPAISSGQAGAAGGVLILSEGTLDAMSSGLASAGDFDNDGVVDLAIGADLYSTEDLDSTVLPAQDGSDRSGALFVVPGTVLLEAEPGAVLQAESYLQTYGSARGDWVGGSALHGDINADGVADVFTGATGVAGTSASGASLDLVGGIAVVFGTSADEAPVGLSDLADASRGLWVGGVDAQQYTVGQYLAVGDVDGDGFDDLAAGVVKSDSEKGAVYILEGPLYDDVLIDDADTILLGADPNGSFGRNLHIDAGAAHPDCPGTERNPMLYVAASTTSDEGVVAGGGVYAFSYGDVAGTVVARATNSSVGRVRGSVPNQQIGFGLTAGGYIDDGDCTPDFLITGAYSTTDDPRGHVLVFQGPLEGVQEETDARALIYGEEPFSRSGWSHTFARAPSLVQARGPGAYPAVHDALVVGGDRFDRDSGTELPRLDAGAVHLFPSLDL
jgi:hypothetical protein